ncbi:hypothetical protein NW762_010159 [Fusarium torreyae]|uniref:Transcription factor domain-containing protein n=1 Tax=Fusarium torreyae TaxID=1237075 RepID=A0A9W8RUL2_9HYPO|nr:hypothetical protein NW762_010159 [Fusarium torreyae]
MSAASRSPRDSGVRKTQNKTSLAHVEDLENRLAQYEGRDQDMGEWLPDATDDPPELVSPSYPAERPSPRQANIPNNDDLPLLPSESEAYGLLEFVSLYIGQSQSHFDVREVSDNIELYYTDQECQLKSPAPWFLRMIIILAVGKLLSGNNVDQNVDDYPGRTLFEFVHKRLPTPSEQHAQGRVAIETLTLLGVYLQAMNRKEEAYLYVCQSRVYTKPRI